MEKRVIIGYPVWETFLLRQERCVRERERGVVFDGCEREKDSDSSFLAEPFY